MSPHNSYKNYRQYRKNRRRYDTEVGAIPALLLIIILFKTMHLLKFLFITFVIILVGIMCYKTYENRSAKVTKIDLDNMNDEMFRIYCIRLLSLNDYKNVRSAKNGIEIIAEKEGLVFGIKCTIKDNETTVDADIIRLAIGGSAYYYCDRTVIVTNRHFSQNAMQLAKDTNILLWDRKKLIALLNNDPCISIV